MRIDTIKVTETSGVELNIHLNLRKLRYYNLTGQFFHISETFNVWNLKMAEGLIFERFGMRYEIQTAASTNARKIILSLTLTCSFLLKCSTWNLLFFMDLNSFYSRTFTPRAKHVMYRKHAL